MSAEEIDLHAQYERKAKVTPTIILQLIEGQLVVTTGPRPVPREEYIYDWDTTWNEPGTDIVAVDQTIQFQKTVAEQPVMIQRCLSEFGEETTVELPNGAGGVAAVAGGIFTFTDPTGLGQWVWDVLHGKDPR